jgi:Asp/Glu/hydantoin racemase
MKKIAIIHTTPATLEPLKALAAELLPGSPVVNWMDDSILPELAANGGDVSAVTNRLLHYARFAQAGGAAVLLSACSSVGEVVATMRQQLTIPVVRIDEAMAAAAVQRGRCLGVAATLPTTLNPTMRLLQQKAAEAGQEIELKPLLVEAAYRQLMSGDKEGHDAILAEALLALAQSADVVVLAQASMARVLPRLPEAIQAQFLSSPRLGMEQVRQVLAE